MTVRYRIAAFHDLLQRYRASFAYAWQHRHETGQHIFSEDEADFMPARLSLQAKPVSSTALVTARMLCFLIVIALVWASVGRIDIVVNAQGKIIPSGHIKTIASVDTASVLALHVVEGQRVKAGELLVELDASASDAERDKAIGNRTEAVLQETRARALIVALDSGRRPQWPELATLKRTDPGITARQSLAEEQYLEGLYSDYLGKLGRVDGDIARYAESLPLVTQTAHDYAALLITHDIAEHAWLEKEHARLDLKGQLADARQQRRALVAQMRRDAYEQLSEGNKIAASAAQDALRSESHSKLLKLTAPVDGVVQQLTMHTIGGVVAAAQPLMQIVPSENSIEVEATIANQDIGFVREGQPARVKVDAFQYTKYGTMQAHVTNVSHDAVPDEKKNLQFTVLISMSKAIMDIDGAKVALSPGMAVNVDIKTGDRRVIEYFLSPLQLHQRESLHER